MFRQLSLLAGSLLICLPAGFAGPGGGVGVGTASAGGGGHAGASAPAAAGHSASIGGSFRSASGLRSGLGSSAGIAGYHSRITSGGIRAMPSVASNPGVLSEGLAQAGATRASMPVARVNNAWTDPVDSRAAATTDERGGVANNARVGTNLNPGAYGYTPSRAGGNSQRGRNDGNGSRSRHHYYINNFPYGVYYPYLYNNYGYGGYGGYGDLGYGSTGDYAGLTADGGAAEPGAPDFVTPANNYYGYVSPDQANPNPAQAAPTQPLPDAPSVGPEDPSSAEKTPSTSQGPDSLVEAVQGELAKRGYFDGKPDAMYSDATKVAIRRFQTDQHLPATGRINEATLHALRLD